MAHCGTALTLAMLLAVVEIGSCLQCYQCNSESDPSCKDPFSSKTAVTDCATQDSVKYVRDYLRFILPPGTVDSITGAPRYCHKIVMQSGTTARMCLDGNPNDLNQTCVLLDNTSRASPMDPNKQLKHCSVCDKDRCNGAASFASSFPLALIALVASFLYYKQ